MTAPATAPTSAVKSSIITNLDATPIVRPTAGGTASGGFGGGIVQRYQSTYTPAASQATSVLARLIRIPSNCVVQEVSILVDAAATTLTGSVGLWFSDVNDGTSLLNQGNLTAISSAFFAYQLVMANFVPTQSGAGGHATEPGDGTVVQLGQTFVPITFANSQGAMTDGQYLPSQSGVPIWLAVANSLNSVSGTAVGAATSSTNSYPFTTTAGTGGSLWTWGSDPGGFFDICLQLTSTGSAANVKVSLRADVIHAMA